MASPFRVYNFLHRITKTQSAELINLNKISSIKLQNKLIKFTIDEKDSICGNMFIFFGGGSVTKRVYFDTHEEAKTEFEEIQKHFEQFHKKS